MQFKGPSVSDLADVYNLEREPTLHCAVHCWAGVHGADSSKLLLHYSPPGACPLSQLSQTWPQHNMVHHVIFDNYLELNLLSKSSLGILS